MEQILTSLTIAGCNTLNLVGGTTSKLTELLLGLLMSFWNSRCCDNFGFQELLLLIVWVFAEIDLGNWKNVTEHEHVLSRYQIQSGRFGERNLSKFLIWVLPHQIFFAIQIATWILTL
jgi:hypothetical protein